jgi:hypothetical protein
MSDRPESLFGCARVRTKCAQKTRSCWFVGTIYDPRELTGVSTVGPEIGRGVITTNCAIGFDDGWLTGRGMIHIYIGIEASRPTVFCWRAGRRVRRSGIRGSRRNKPGEED